MKILKKAVVILLGAVFLTAAAGCGEGSGSANSFTLNYFLGGYGRQYIEALAEDYEELTGVEVRLKQSGSNDDAKNKIMSGTGDDMYLANTNFFGLQAYLANLNDLYEMEVYGEEGVKVKDKIDPRMLEYYKEEGGYYQVSENVMTGFNWVYNKTLLDNTFGAGKYQLPRTTEEFFEFGDKLQKENIFLFATALGGKAYEDYTEYAWRTWLMQMMGNEAYEQFYNGYYMNDQGEWVRSLESPDPLFDANAVAIEETYDVARRLCQPAKASGSDVQYIHSRSGSLNFKDVDVMFYGGKIGGVDLSKAAFIFTGIWLEREVLPYIEAGVVDISEQQAMPMRPPVMSRIVTRTPSIAAQSDPEAALRTVIDYIDGVSETKPAWLTDPDLAIVTEARKAIPKGIEDSIMITNYSRKIDLCKDFITYLVSDRAQKIAAQHASGIPVLPYGYEPTEEDMGFEISPFTQEYLRLAEDSVLVDMSHGNKPFAKTIGMVWYADKSRLGNDRLTKALFYKDNVPAKTELLEATKSQFRNGWENLIDTFFEKYGEDA